LRERNIERPLPLIFIAIDSLLSQDDSLGRDPFLDVTDGARMDGISRSIRSTGAATLFEETRTNVELDPPRIRDMYSPVEKT
jgi:hypothetical protein